MEERETEEVGGRSSRKSTATVSAAFLPPCIGAVVRCQRAVPQSNSILRRSTWKEHPVAQVRTQLKAAACQQARGVSSGAETANTLILDFSASRARRH
ncbi:uncharacterized protein LOC121501369 isoform X1 [Vulpes lagopus]|uniref:uncharacterized protein LOC121501369 isoform X1 n=1 Tax=Vulpes lagopus TaxID=494514 RepID=UPI001BC9702A|nr:uncharacterized protein LOC121501369 isoform X1 [Vulpes lagopus]